RGEVGEIVGYLTRLAVGVETENPELGELADGVGGDEAHEKEMQETRNGYSFIFLSHRFPSLTITSIHRLGRASIQEDNDAVFGNFGVVNGITFSSSAT
ncbi:hypothetical protein CRG98_001836, partial [Punica granatum]